MIENKKHALNEKIEIKKGRPKKEEKEKKFDESYMVGYTFGQKISFELKSLELEPSDTK